MSGGNVSKRNTAALRWSVKHGVFLVASTEGNVDDAEWQRLLDDLRLARASAYLGLALGNTTANPQQRRAMFVVLKTKQVRTLLVTDSALTRGFVTIAAWFGVNARAFSVAQTPAALEATGLDMYQQTDVAQALDALRAAVAGKEAA